MRELAVAALCGMAVLLAIAWALWVAPRCAANAPKGPTLGGVFKLFGC